MADVTAERLVDFTRRVAFDELPPATVHAAKRVLVDSIGCAIAAYHQEEVRALRELASRSTAAPPATMLGTSTGTTPELAALVNGVMIRCLDFNDDYFGGAGDLGPHPSDNIGSILAAVEATGGGGRDLVEGITVAYEVVAQIIDQISPRGRSRTWDYTVFHAAGSALASGLVLGLSNDQLRHALGIAVVSNLGLYQTRSGQLTNWKAFAGPNASRSGLFAALLAQAGVTGPGEPFEGKAGLCRHLENPFDLGPFGSATTPFKVESAYFKSLPVRYTNQLGAHIALTARRHIRPEDIASMVVYGIKRDVVSRERFPEQWEPASRETADHSAPYLIAAAFVDGEISARTFTPERYRDPTILDLAARLSIEEDPRYTAAFPGRFSSRIEVRLTSGQMRTFEQDNPKGHPANPMSDEELEQKFLGQVSELLPASQSRALLDQLWSLETLTSMKPLMELARVPR